MDDYSYIFFILSSVILSCAAPLSVCLIYHPDLNEFPLVKASLLDSMNLLSIHEGKPDLSSTITSNAFIQYDTCFSSMHIIGFVRISSNCGNL